MTSRRTSKRDWKLKSADWSFVSFASIPTTIYVIGIVALGLAIVSLMWD